MIESQINMLTTFLIQNGYKKNHVVTIPVQKLFVGIVYQFCNGRNQLNISKLQRNDYITTKLLILSNFLSPTSKFSKNLR